VSATDISNYSVKSKKLIVSLLLTVSWPREFMKHPHYKNRRAYREYRNQPVGETQVE